MVKFYIFLHEELFGQVEANWRLGHVIFTLQPVREADT